MGFSMHRSEMLPVEVMAIGGKCVQCNSDKTAKKGLLQLVQTVACESRLASWQAQALVTRTRWQTEKALHWGPGVMFGFDESGQRNRKDATA